MKIQKERKKGDVIKKGWRVPMADAVFVMVVRQ
jgi:hypothetical protein